MGYCPPSKLFCPLNKLNFTIAQSCPPNKLSCPHKKKYRHVVIITNRQFRPKICAEFTNRNLETTFEHPPEQAIHHQCCPEIESIYTLQLNIQARILESGLNLVYPHSRNKSDRQDWLFFLDVLIIKSRNIKKSMSSLQLQYIACKTQRGKIPGEKSSL